MESKDFVHEFELQEEVVGWVAFRSYHNIVAFSAVGSFYSANEATLRVCNAATTELKVVPLVKKYRK